MSLVELVRAATRGIGGNLTRSILTLLMVVIGVSSVITLVAVGNGATKQVNDQITAMGAAAVTVIPGWSDTGGPARELTVQDVQSLTSSLVAVDIAEVAPQVSAQKTVAAGSRSAQVEVVGTTAAYFGITNAQLQQGRLLTASDAWGTGNVAVLDSRTSNQLFPAGDAVGSTIVVDATPLTVVGVVAPASGPSTGGGATLLAPIGRVQASLTGYGALSSISFAASSPDRVDVAVRQARAVLAARSGVPASSVSAYFITPDELRATLGGSNKSLSNMLSGVASISLIVGGIGVTNVMLLTVRERTREIGIRKALGGRNGSIAGQFMLEATTLSVLGGALGVAVAFVLSRFTINGVPPLIQPSTVALAAGLSVGIGVVFGTYPAIRASRMDPVAALRVSS